MTFDTDNSDDGDDYAPPSERPTLRSIPRIGDRAREVLAAEVQRESIRLSTEAVRRERMGSPMIEAHHAREAAKPLPWADREDRMGRTECGCGLRAGHGGDCAPPMRRAMQRDWAELRARHTLEQRPSRLHLQVVPHDDWRRTVLREAAGMAAFCFVAVAVFTALVLWIGGVL